MRSDLSKICEIRSLLQQAFTSVRNAKFDLNYEEDLLNDLDEIQLSLRSAFTLLDNLESELKNG